MKTNKLNVLMTTLAMGLLLGSASALANTETSGSSNSGTTTEAATPPSVKGSTNPQQGSNDTAVDPTEPMRSGRWKVFEIL
jgi:hypothetical protein